ncbi:acyl-CoA dehydrogenase family protein [Leifsonia aquatica]|uniref:acyl-CoA dehydrogenase family protein n=1 Tax=Leifsonia aquatica TaxID=144185 RepID=UPI003850496B
MITSSPPREFATSFSHERWQELSDTGLFSSLSDQTVPGAGLPEAMRRVRELGRTSPDRGLTFSAVTQLASTVYCLSAFGGPAVRSRYLPSAESGAAIGGHAITEELAGSDISAMVTSAIRDGDNYVLDGTKKFITNAPIADTLVVYAKDADTNGGLSAFLIETGWPGISISDPMPTAGLRSSPLGEVTLDRVRVPAENRIGHAGAGLLVLDQVMKREILLAFAANLGEMERSLNESVAFANGRQQFGRSIGSNQLVANRIVESRIAIELGSALLESIVDRLDGFDDVTIPIAAAKIFISEAHVGCALNAISLRGGTGYLTTEPYCDNLLDAVPGTIYSGSNDVLRSKIAAMMGVAT